MATSFLERLQPDDQQGIHIVSTHAKEDFGSGQSKTFVFLIDMKRCSKPAWRYPAAGRSPDFPLNPLFIQRDVILDPEVLDFHECATSNGHMEEVLSPALGSSGAIHLPVN